MAITPDWPTKTFSIPQADLTLVSGTLYTLNTETQFRQNINALMASEEGIVFEDPISHNTEVTVFGVTYARTIEVINGYSVTFTPDSQYSVRLEGSNNNLADVQTGVLNQNQVQVIPTNSAGLIVTQLPGSGLDASQDAKLTNIDSTITDQLMNVEGGWHHKNIMRLISAVLAGKLGGAEGTTIVIRDVHDNVDRLVVTVDGKGNRTGGTYDVS